MTVLGLYANPGASQAAYRIQTPLSVVPGVRWGAIDQVDTADLAGVTTVVLHGIGGPAEDVRAVFDRIRQAGVRRVLVDYDDALYHTHPFTPARIQDAAWPGIHAALTLADGLIVTTEALRDHFRPHTRLPIAVVPNLIDPARWPTPPAPASPPVVVIAGSPSHHYDWETVIPALLWLRQAAPDVQIRLMGYGHPVIRQIATQGVSWCPPDAYRVALAGGAIGLCPLPDTPFNRGKTPVKAIEYSLAAGMAVIGSPLLYGPLLAGGRGRVVPDGDTAGWARCLAFYLAYPDVRHREAAALRSHILTTCDVHAHAAALAAIYTGDPASWHCSSKGTTALCRSAQPTRLPPLAMSPSSQWNAPLS